MVSGGNDDLTKVIKHILDESGIQDRIDEAYLQDILKSDNVRNIIPVAFIVVISKLNQSVKFRIC